jgi:hypothetical protein
VITFLDGPAHGQSFTLLRAPVLLRVVSKQHTYADGRVYTKWDALDLFSDVAVADEAIHLYESVGIPQFVHLDGRDRKTGKRWGRTEYHGEYRLFTDPPADDVLRDNVKWVEWCESVKERVMAEREVGKGGAA